MRYERPPGYYRVHELEGELPAGFEVYEGVETVGLLCTRCQLFAATYSASGELTPSQIAQDARDHLVTDHGAAA